MTTIPTSTDIADPLTYLPSPSLATVVPAASPVELAEKVRRLCEHIAARGLIFEPWQIAAFITAVRTKPFVILAGISGTGKTRLTRTIADITASSVQLCPVKPDWTDSAEIIGFEGLDGKFRPGRLLQFAADANQDLARESFFLLDEMNIARVEYYFAEVLSVIEDRSLDSNLHIITEPLFGGEITDPTAQEWTKVRLPSNVALVGSVNMDETTHGFSRKVLDRAFVLEFSDVDLTELGTSEEVVSDPWSAQDWAVQYLDLSRVQKPLPTIANEAITTLTDINKTLKPLQVQVGYRVRDEVALFCMNAEECSDSFVTRGGATVDPLDLAVLMKVLPRIQGGGRLIEVALQDLIGWASGSNTLARPFPICAARLDAMNARLKDEGFTSFWV